MLKLFFDENNKYYPQVFLNECLHEILKMKIKDKLKEIGIKNRTCYYFNNIMRVIDLNFNNISLDEKLCKNFFENILVYDIWYKTIMGKKP